MPLTEQQNIFKNEMNKKAITDQQNGIISKKYTLLGR